ncbi:MAG TPA: hypothetical protein VKV15_03325 [Bryobacteraceae bacterium]|nr:hypothetical protein [Bryobacteraceae bacterium]
MSQERRAQIVTVLILVAALAVVLSRKYGWKVPVSLPVRAAIAVTPQDTIYSMLDAAREGNTRKYLSNYTGQMEASLKQAIAEQGESGFVQYLKDSNAPIKGIAITEPQILTDSEVKVRVEYVYQDRNEVQYMYLDKVNGAWKIARVDSTERVKTLVPYGTPVQ